MSWPTEMDPDLREFLELRQDSAIKVYTVDPNLLEEHRRQEESFRTGGYGDRQVSELLQNAVDAIGSGRTGMVELRLADGNLYCANEGEPFGEAGVRAVTYAFLSSKRKDQIGRFGLGFKSVLGVSDNPQVYSHKISFQFNDPQTTTRVNAALGTDADLPLLRIPTVTDPFRAAAADRNLAELMEWATTIVKLPLTRNMDRIREELERFNERSLLFFKSLSTLRISIQKSPGTAPESRDLLREQSTDGREVTLTSAEGKSARWLYAEREYKPSRTVLDSLPETARRPSMLVSYAVRPEQRNSTGSFWAWFPLKDETTASGYFNAPWHVNDDRTSLIMPSLLNTEMLKVAADLFLDVIVRASTPSNPAGHLSLLPARGREVRSRADDILSRDVPDRAAQRPIIPDLKGVLRHPGYFTGVPGLSDGPEGSLSRQSVAAWASCVERDTFPHPDCFASPTSRSRLRTLMTAAGKRAAPTVSIAKWLGEAVASADPARVARTIVLARELREQSPQMKGAVAPAAIVLLEGGGWARIDDSLKVLLPSEDMLADPTIKIVDRRVAAVPETMAALRDLGFREQSADEVVMAIAAGASPRWAQNEWRIFWNAAASASQRAAEDAINRIRVQQIDVLLPTVSGKWRPATQVLSRSEFALDLVDRHLDLSIVPNHRLALVAGACTRPAPRHPLSDDGLRTEYCREIEAEARRQARDMGVTVAAVDVPCDIGVGPLDILADEGLSPLDRANWTADIVKQMDRDPALARIRLRGRTPAELPVVRFERWAAVKYGAVRTSHGVLPPTEALSSDLSRFRTFLAVAMDPQVSEALELVDNLRKVPRRRLEDFLQGAGYKVGAEEADAFAELLETIAARKDMGAPEWIPAVSGGQVELHQRSTVVVTDRAADSAAADEAGLAYIPAEGRYTALVERWGLQRAEEAIQRSTEIRGASNPAPILDRFPTLQKVVTMKLANRLMATAESIELVTQSVQGVSRAVRPFAVRDGVIFVDRGLDDAATLARVSDALGLGLGRSDIQAVLKNDEKHRQSKLIAAASAAPSDEERLLLLVGADAMRARFPDGLLAAVEAQRGHLTDEDIADLFLRVHGQEAVRALRDELEERGVAVPSQWDGSDAAVKMVKELGFDTSFAGTRDVRPPAVTHVQGRVELKPLHSYQEALARQIGTLATTFNETTRRGLLYLPTGAGKTRVTVQAILGLLMRGEVRSPILWIAQSVELCEQAIESFTEVWRAIGDTRPLDVSRFWSGYELDESPEELQVVVAIDDTLKSRLPEPQYEWLTTPGMVVIDEAHTAGSKTYTEILAMLGLTARETPRPLLGLTATPFRGTNPEVNERFVQRFGKNRLEALPPEREIEYLRSEGVLSEVDYRVLEGKTLSVNEQDDQFRTLREVSKSMLTSIGADMDRTQTVVRDIVRELGEHPDWPILVFAASVPSAHTIAALLRLEGIEADSIDGSARKGQRRATIDRFKSGETQVLVNCDLLTQGFDAPKVRALYIARPTFSPNRYLQMVGRGLRGPKNGGTERCLIVNVRDTFDEFGSELAYTEFDYLWNRN